MGSMGSFGDMGSDHSAMATGGPSAFFGSRQAREGANRAADAAQRAAEAQLDEAARQFNLIDTMTNRSVDEFRKNTVGQLLQYDETFKKQEKNIARQEQLVSQIDPTIVEASQQALRLLRGEQSSTLAPIKQQRDMQRQQLVNSLREQLGPGAETSTAGIQALTRFDSETSSLMAGAQQQALGNLGGLAQQFTSTRPDIFRELMGLNETTNRKTGIHGKIADMGMDRARILGGQGQSVIQYAGAPHVAETAKGQFGQAMGNAMYESGVQQQTAIITSAIGGASKIASGGK